MTDCIHYKTCNGAGFCSKGLINNPCNANCEFYSTNKKHNLDYTHANKGIYPFTAGAKWADEHPATTKELKDYTTEELKAELKRRQLEARRGMKHKTEYAYVMAIVRSIDKYASFGRYYNVEIEISKEDLPQYGIDLYRAKMDVSLDGKIKAADRPNVGDTVILRSLKTKNNPTGFGYFAKPKICEVISRKI